MTTVYIHIHGFTKCFYTHHSFNILRIWGPECSACYPLVTLSQAFPQLFLAVVFWSLGCSPSHKLLSLGASQRLLPTLGFPWRGLWEALKQILSWGWGGRGWSWQREGGVRKLKSALHLQFVFLPPPRPHDYWPGLKCPRMLINNKHDNLLNTWPYARYHI